MPRTRIVLPDLAVALFAAALFADRAAFAGGGPQNLIVVVNDDSQESLDVANHYRLARQVPAACFCHVRAKSVHDYPRGDFERDILNPLLEHVRKNGLEGHARFVVFTKGLPYRIQWNSTTQVSVTTPAAAGTMGIGPMNQQPYYQAKAHFRGLPGLPYLAVCLTGYTVEDVKRCIDQGVASDGTMPPGTIYLFDGVGPRARVHPAYGRDEAIAGLKERGVKFEVRPEHSLTNEQDVLGYWTGAVRVNTKGIRFLPGALADHLTSFGGILFDNKSQMSILDFIQAGATGSYGTVMEPTNIPSRHSQGWVFCRYASGLSLIESYWAAVQDVQIGVFVGEPLACPFGRRPAVKIEGADPNKPCAGELRLRITAAPAKEGVRLRELSWWVDGRPFGPALPLAAAAGTRAVLKVGERSVEAAFDPAAGVEGLAKALAEAVGKDESLARADGIRAKAAGGRLLLEAKAEGPALNGTPVSVEVRPPEGASGDAAIRADAGAGSLAGGAETVEVPAQVEITLDAKKLAKGDSITIVTAGATFSATADEKDAASEQPLVALLRKLTEPMKSSKALRDPQARAAGSDRTHIVVALASAKKGEEGNGQEVEVRFEKQKDSDFSVRPVGKLKLDGGAVRRAFASAAVEFVASFAPPKGAEAVLDTARLGDGWHAIRLVAEEDTEAAAQGFATAGIRVANGKGRVALNVPKKPDFSKPFAVTATLSGTYPGGAKRYVLVVDGRDAGDLDPNGKKLVLDRAKVPLGAGRHALQVRAEPKQAGNPPLLSEPVEVEVPAAKK